MSELKVYESIAAVCAALAKEGISKERKNQQQNYVFRGIDDVYGALAPALVAANLVIVPRFLNRSQTEHQSQRGGTLFKVIVEGEFDVISALDGSKHTARTFGEAMDSADKATNKAMSAAYKYMAFQLFCIPTEGDNDADATTPELAPTPPQQAQSPRTTPTPPLPDKRTPEASRARKVASSGDVVGNRYATDQTRAWMTAELLRIRGFNRELVTQYAIDKAILMPNEKMEDWPLQKVPTSRQALGVLVEDIERWRNGGAPAEHQPPPAPEEEWRAFPMPFGKQAGVKLGELDKKYLFGLWANYAVEKEYNGKPLSAERIAKDTKFREMLDQAGKHYNFTKREDQHIDVPDDNQPQQPEEDDVPF